MTSQPGALANASAVLQPERNHQHRYERGRLLVVLVLVCTGLALVRAWESLSLRGETGIQDVLIAMRWRVWDWWFWLPASALVWKWTARWTTARWLTISILGQFVGLLVALIAAHRLYSLLGMWLFVREVSLAQVFRVHQVLDVSGLVAPDLLMMALVSYAAVLHAQYAERRARVLRRRRSRRTATPPALAPTNPSQSQVPWERVLVRVGTRQVIAETSGILWVEADGYCSRLHMESGVVHVVRTPMAQFERSLDSSVFVRVHRSAIARIASIRELGTQGDIHHVLLTDGSRLPVSRSRYAEVRRKLGSVAKP